MKTLALLSLSITVALGMPPFPPGVAQNPVLTKEDQSPLLGDFVPVQGHVAVEDPAPQFRLGSEEQLDKLAPVPLAMEQSMVEPEIKVKPQVGEKKVKTEAKKEPEVKVEQELKPEPVKVDLEADVAPEENLNTQVMAELKVDEMPKVEMEPEFKDDPDFKVESEVKVEPDVQEEFQVQMNLEAETKTGWEIEKRHTDMEGKYKKVGEPIMELEPLDDDDDDNMSVDELSNTELSEVEKSFRAAFQNQDLVNQPLPEPEKGLIQERSYVLDEEPIMELETPQDKVDQDVKTKPEVNLNTQVMAELKVDEMPKVEMEPEFKDDPDFKVESEVKVEPDVQEEFQVQMNLEAETKTGWEIEKRHTDMEGKYKMVGEPIMELEPLNDDDDDNMSVDELSNTELSEVEKSFRAAFQNQDLVNQPLPEQEKGLTQERSYVLDEEPIMELETPQDKVDQDVKTKPEVNLNPEVMAELNVDEKPKVEMEPEFKVESEVKVEPDVQEEFQVQMNRTTKTETDETKERHIDMEGKYEMVGEPIMELEPLDDDNMELSEVEKSLRAAFQNQNPVNYPLPEERGLFMSEMDSDGEPIMELVPLDDDNMSGKELSNTELSEVEKSLRAAFQNQNPVNHPLPEERGLLMRKIDSDGEPRESEGEVLIHQQVMPDAAIMKEGPALDIIGQPILALEDYFPNEEARMGMEQEQDSLMVERSHYLMMEEPSRESRCSGVMLEGKCYQFFKGPKGAADAELFCQENFPGGHLASITSQHIHREVMNMMLRQNMAHTRTWIGGLRYLETGRFIWLDGSHWGYADWLSGEPNNTADVEECVEVLAHENGKFNDFTCLEAQAFICSYSY